MNMPRAMGILMTKTRIKDSMKAKRAMFMLSFSPKQKLQIRPNIPSDTPKHDHKKNDKRRKGYVHRDLQHIGFFEAHKYNVIVTGVQGDTECSE
jgi:hypothetical protein